MGVVGAFMAQHWVAARPGGLEVFDFVSYEVPPPASGEVTVEVRAAGVNPGDASHVAEGRRGPFPRSVGYEIAGVLTAIGPETDVASGGGAVGDEVLIPRPAPPNANRGRGVGSASRLPAASHEPHAVPSRSSQ